MTAIALDAVSKRYTQSVERPLLLNRLLRWRRQQRHLLWALRDVSLRCERGETLGVIGRNGSGKTTLLKLLAGVSAPTGGRLRIEGRVAPLIGIGVGFNHELSGGENVVVNGQLLGLTAAQVRSRFDEIVDFAGMAEFIDTPVKYYSSGMFLRLAFAVAIHTDPDVFLIDEILAVGDAAFQAKCLERLRQVQERGTTIVVVTHNLQMLQQMAPRTVLLDHGEVVFSGETDTALSEYQSLLQRAEVDAATAARAALSGSEAATVVGGASVSLTLHDDDGETSRAFRTGATITVRLHVEFTREVTAPRVGVLVSTTGGQGVFSVATETGDHTATHGPGRPLDAEFRLVNRLLSRTYLVQGGVYEATGNSLLANSPLESFAVIATHRTAGIVDLEPAITVSGRPVAVRSIDRLGGDSA